MISGVLDGSAVLAFLQAERGAELVEQHLSTGAMSAVNWSEVLQKTIQAGRDPRRVGALLRGLGLQVEPVTAEDGEVAAELWPAARHLSLADRLCLTLGMRLGVQVLTADKVWGQLPNLATSVLVIR
jgi:ribonuclease VapC